MKRLLFTVAAIAALVVPAGVSWAQTPTTIKADEFCSSADQGQTRTAGNGEQVTCTTGPDGRLRWEPASQVANRLPTTATTAATVATTTTVASAAATATTTTTVATTMPRTGRPLGQEAALGVAVGALGAMLVWWARPKLRALFSGPELIPYERIEQASGLLGWSEGWREHLSKKG